LSEAKKLSATALSHGEPLGIAARARPNTVRAYAHDLKIFFTIVVKEPAEVTSRDVLAFVTRQRRGRAGTENVVRITDGLSAATIKRRLAAVSALYGYLVVRGDAGVSANPVPRGLPTRQRRRNGPKVVPLVRGVRRLPNGSWTRPMSTGCWARCAPSATERSSRRCCCRGVGDGVALADVGDDLPGGDLDTAAATGGFMYSATRSRVFSTS
jgi:hypothetical protein